MKRERNVKEKVNMNKKEKNVGKIKEEKLKKKNIE